MDSQIQDAVTDWESRSVADGYEGIRRLADEEFTGAVAARRTWAFVLNGRIVGVVDGTVDAFEGASLAVYEAPDPALPLLFAMMTGESRERAKYYTEDTPLSEADATLSEGGFTGYVELSDNVHSGDYYVVYHAGKSMSAAFLGNRRRLVTGDEAFDRADDEVGVYHVHEADVEVTEVPEPEADDGPSAASDAGDDPTTATATPAGRPDGAAESERDADADDDGDTDADAGSGTGDDAASDDRRPEEDAGTEPAGTDDRPVADVGNRADAEGPETESGSGRRATGPREAGDGAEPADEADPGRGEADAEVAPAVDAGPDAADGEAGRESEAPADAAAGSEDPAAADADDATGEADPAGSSTERPDAAATDADDDAETGRSGERSTGRDRDRSDAGSAGGGTAAPDESDDVTTGASGTAGTDGATSDRHGDAAEGGDPFSAEERWREARGIPALDPDGTGAGDPPAASRETGGSGQANSDRARDRPDRPTDPEQSRPGADARARDGEAAPDPERVADLRSRLESAEAAREEAESALESAEERADRLETERDELRAERDELRERADRLQERVEELEAEVSRLESALASTGASPDAESVGPAEALEGTHLFVRYDEASGATLKKLHDGEATRDEVAGNIRLEYHHTNFDTEDVVVDGESFDEFLRSTTQYRFVDWLVDELLYDIEETGNREALADLFDAIPEMDHVEFEGGVSVPSGEDVEASSETVAFDVVVRDGMGNPLVVADLNTERTAASRAQMSDLLTGARRVAEAKRSLAGAFLVTASFFDPGALETAAEQTDSGGFFGGSSRKSFVKLSRKSGFHICLVETRDGAFHVNVPEL